MVAILMVTAVNMRSRVDTPIVEQLSSQIGKITAVLQPSALNCAASRPSH
jgi:hypothetical protein